MLIDIGDLKMAREALCAILRGLDRSGMGLVGSEAQRLTIQSMIDQIDVFRPLGSNGKHGNLHTPYCGCDVEWLNGMQRRFDDE